MDEELMRILACPACRGGVSQAEDFIVCSDCGRRYPIRDGIPILLIDEAQESSGDTETPVESS